MLFRTMALEEPGIRVLNYAPGPIDTSMQYEARNFTADKELKQMFKGISSFIAFHCHWLKGSVSGSISSA